MIVLFGFLALLLGLPCAQDSQPVPAAPPHLEGRDLADARALIERVAKGLQGVERMHADFTQEQHTALLNKALSSAGRLSLRASPGCLVLELSRPKHAFVRSDTTSHRVYYPADKRAERYQFESNDLAKGLFSIMTARIASIEETFQLTSLKRGAEQSVIELRLRKATKQRILDSLSITVDNKHAGLLGLAFVNADGEKTTLRLSHLRRITAASSAEERALEADVFDRPLPKNVRVVVHRVPRRSKGE
jgi:outer membrane lipoprotein-sorting protein